MNRKRLITLSLIMLMLICIGSATELAAQTRIMCLGDSITGSPGCWRAILWNLVKAAGYTDFIPVGTLYPQGCPQGDDGYNEGHGGYLATGIANQNLLPPWLSATNPDIVLMHLGTNDIFSGTNTTEMILAAYTTMVGQMRANNPNMIILVAQIIPVYTPTTQCTECYYRVIDLNAAIPAWAAGLTTTQSPIIVVDQWTGFDTTTDTSDGIHPNDLGIVKIADKWYPPLYAVLTGGSVTPAPTSVTTTVPTDIPTTEPVTAAPTDAPTADPATPAPTDAPTDTPAPTVTPGPTAIPTATPVGVTVAPTTEPVTIAPTDAPSVTDVPVVTDAPTTPPGDCTCTCPNLCSSTTAISIPFSFDGAGEFCWTATSLGTYINSWNCDTVNINGTSYTNTYVSSSTIPSVCGVYYIYFKATYSWSHIEIK